MASMLPANKTNIKADLSGSDFSGQDLSGYIFKGCNLTGVNFSDCKFDAATDFTDSVFGATAAKKVSSFSGCNLAAAKFSVPAQFGKKGGKKTLTNLTKTTIPWPLLGKSFQFVDISDALITGLPADFAKISLTSVKWNNYNFNGKSLRNAHFTNCDLTCCIMNNVNLDYVSFTSQCDLTSVKMNGCSLDAAVFDGSNMTDTDLSYASRFRACSFLNTLLKGTKFDGNDIRDSYFTVPCSTSEDPAHITSFQFATIEPGFMVKNLQKNWQCMDFRNVIINNFSSITGQLQNLKAMNSFFNSSLSFENAVLNGANFKTASFNAVNFNGSTLNNATLIGAKTLQGTEMGIKGAKALITQDNPVYATFLEALTKKNEVEIKNLFQQLGLTLKNVQCQDKKDPETNNQTWHIVDSDVIVDTPRLVKKFIVMQLPVPGAAANFKLLIFDNSPSTFTYAHMVGCYMQDCDFSNSNLAHAQLYGATITYATLSNVDLTAAQLGKNAAIFSVSEKNTTQAAPFDYKSFLKSLQTPVLSDLIDIFKYNGYYIENIACAAAIAPAGAELAWMITDNASSPVKKFLVAKMVIKANPKEYELSVFFENGLAANLYASYMPGAILTKANLTGCSANKCHLYNNQQNGSNAVLTEAILIGVNFDDANLYKADFTKAILNGTSFNRANLMGAIFKGVTLAPGDERVISFNSANLQGAEFLDATIEGATFLEAAISLPVKTSPTRTNGVQIHRTYAKNDPDFDRYLRDLNNAEALSFIGYDAEADADKIDEEDDNNDDDEYDTGYVIAGKYMRIGTIDPELRALLNKITKTIDDNPLSIAVTDTAVVSFLQKQKAWKIKDKTNEYLIVPGFENFLVSYNVYSTGNVPVCSIDYYTKFKEGDVSKELTETLRVKSGGKIALSSEAKLLIYERSVAWRITDNNTDYILWYGVKLVKKSTRYKLANVIYVRRSVDYIDSFFRSVKINLRNQSLFKKTTDTAEDTVTWLVDTGKEDALYLNAGYVQYKIVASPAVQPTRLVLYGYTMRMLGFGNNQRMVMQDFDCGPTKITEAIMDQQTSLPNNKTKFQNKDDKLPFEEWMWVTKDHFPEPPACVPSPISYCPTVPGKIMSIKKSDTFNETL